MVHTKVSYAFRKGSIPFGATKLKLSHTRPAKRRVFCVNYHVDLPSKIKIAAYDVKIIPYVGQSARVNEVFGEFSSVENTIHIDTSISTMQIAETLIHEINHAIYYIYSLDDSDQEERVVSMFATAWMQIYRDNPHFLVFICDILKNIG